MDYVAQLVVQGENEEKKHSGLQIFALWREKQAFLKVKHAFSLTAKLGQGPWQSLWSNKRAKQASE